MTKEKLESRVTELESLLQAEKEKNAFLEQRIYEMRIQEASMARLFRGAEPTLEGRIAHAKYTGGIEE